MSVAPPGRPAISVLAALVLAGLALRLAWLAHVYGAVDAPLAVGEATRAALAVARHGTLADAWFDGQGPTAHLMPLHPLTAGGIVRLLGADTAGTLTLLAWACAGWVAGVVLLHRLAIALALPRRTAGVAAAVLCLAIPFAQQEVVDFRFWEGGTAALLGTAHLLLIVAADRRGGLDARSLAAAAATFALSAIVSPPVALAAAAAWGVFALRRLTLPRAAAFAAACALAALVLLAPWALRNEAALGERVWLRSNAGLELAIANHPAAVGGAPAGAVFGERLRAVHPAANPALHEVVRNGGEVAYARALGRTAVEWMRAHPADAARLYVRHLRQLFVPEPWQFAFSGWSGWAALRAGVVGAVHLLGLAGLAMLVRRRAPGWGYVAVYVAALALPFGLFQPTARYTYLFWGLLTLPAAALVTGAAGRAAGRAPLPAAAATA